MEIYGVKLIGVNLHTGEKLLFTLGFILAFVILRNVLRALTQLLFSRYQDVRLRFWIRQGIDLASTLLLLVAAGHYVARGLPRDLARENVQCRRSDHDGGRAR
jgi:hypothetical protein